MAGSDEQSGFRGAAPTESDPADPWIGQTLGSYTIIERVGQGGMGIVYLAQNPSLDRAAAIKFLAAHLVIDKTYIDMFVREAKAAAKLNHPNIVTIYDSGCIGGDVYYLVMEYIEGKNLRTILKERQGLPIPEAVHYIRQVCAGLGYAHKKKIIHRDVKPENLMLTDDGIVKIGDLGLAKRMGDEGSMTQTGMMMGSPFYIAPERLRGDPNVNETTDIYSLGGTFFHLVTGNAPYEGTAPVVMAKHLEGPVADPRELVPSIDKQLAEIIQKMMAKDQKDRYQNMEELDDELADYEMTLSNPVMKALPGRMKSSTGMRIPDDVRKGSKSRVSPPVVGSPPPSGDGRKTALTVVAMAAVLLLIGAGYLLYVNQSRGPTRSPRPAPAPPPAAASSADGLVLADFNGSSTTPTGDFLGDASYFPNGGHISQSVDQSAGAWKIDFDISQKGATARAWIKHQDVDTAPFKSISFRIKTGGGTLDVPVELSIGPATPRHVVKGIGEDWLVVRIPFDSLGLKERKPFSEFTIYFEPYVSGPSKGTLFIDDVTLNRD